MADYKELLRRAIEALAENNGAARRTVYERARSALVEQLRAVDPPLPAREITQHRLKLEDCIRQVEQEATEALLHTNAAAPEPPPAPTRATVPETSAEEQAERAVAEALGAEAGEEPEPPAEAKRAAKPAAKAVADSAAEAEPVASVEQGEQVDDAAPASPDAEADQIEGAPSETEAESEPESEAAPDKTIEPAAKPAAKSPTPAAKAANGSGEPSGDPSAGGPKPKGKRARPAPESVEAAADARPEAEHHAEHETEAVEPDEEPVSIEQVIAAAQREAEGEEETAPPPTKASARPVVKPAARIEEPTRRRSWLRGPSGDRQQVMEADDAERQRALEASIGAAMSSVREVDVEAERASEESKSAELDESPQAAIDRAIAALDREVNGAADEAGDEMLPKGETGTDAAEEAREPDATGTMPEMDEPLDTDYWSEADAAQFEAGQREEFESAPLLEDDGAGRGGVTIFLVLVVVLMVAAGGGGYWAWQQGYLDLGGLMARVGLAGGSEEAATEPLETAEPTAVDEDQGTAGNTEASGGAAALPSDTALPEDGAGIEDADKIDERLPAESTGPVVETAPPAEPSATPAVEPEPTQLGEAAPAASGTQVETPPATAEPAGGGEPEATTSEPTQQALVDPALAEGSQSILLEEQGGGATGPAPFSGSVQWSREVDELGLPVIRARADIPARNLTVDLLIRKNSDDALPASHLMEINFSVLESFVGGGIASLPGVLLKDEELAQGRPLVGASARVFDNSFLFALSAEPADLSANRALLRDQAWLDLPMVYSTGRRAILTLEKGEEGDAIFKSVMDAWAAE